MESLELNNNDISKPDSVNGKGDIIIHAINNYVERKDGIDSSPIAVSINADKETGSGTQDYWIANPLLNQITIKDYEYLQTIKDCMKFNKRTFKSYLWDGLVYKHRLLSVIFKHSLIDPFYLRISKLIFDISLTFGLNAMTYSDYYIEIRALSRDKVFNH
jgi:hypothetical protein